MHQDGPAPAAPRAGDDGDAVLQHGPCPVREIGGGFGQDLPRDGDVAARPEAGEGARVGERPEPLGTGPAEGSAESALAPAHGDGQQFAARLGEPRPGETQEHAARLQPRGDGIPGVVAEFGGVGQGEHADIGIKQFGNRGLDDIGERGERGPQIVEIIEERVAGVSPGLRRQSDLAPPPAVADEGHRPGTRGVPDLEPRRPIEQLPGPSDPALGPTPVGGKGQFGGRESAAVPVEGIDQDGRCRSAGPLHRDADTRRLPPRRAEQMGSVADGGADHVDRTESAKAAGEAAGGPVVQSVRYPYDRGGFRGFESVQRIRSRLAIRRPGFGFQVGQRRRGGFGGHGIPDRRKRPRRIGRECEKAHRPSGASRLLDRAEGRLPEGRPVGGGCPAVVNGDQYRAATRKQVARSEYGFRGGEDGQGRDRNAEQEHPDGCAFAGPFLLAQSEQKPDRREAYGSRARRQQSEEPPDGGQCGQT